MSMRSSLIGVLSIVGTLAFALPVIAQDENYRPARNPSGRELGRVVNGNRTIVFAPADTRTIDADRLQIWGNFADAHPRVAQELAYNNSLMNSGSYLSKHPALDEFYRAHPDIKEAMEENPGNFVAIQPRPGE